MFQLCVITKNLKIMIHLKNIMTVLSLVFIFNISGGQVLGEVKTKFDNIGMKPKSNASKKLYINTFSVMVEVYREDTNYKGKTEFRGKGRGESTATAALGLIGVDADALQKETDKLYDEIIADLKAKGFELISDTEAKNTKFHSKSVPFQGPMVRESANPGMLEVIPTNFKGLTSEKNAAGEKSNKSSGLFPGLKGSVAMLKTSNGLSKELDDAIVVDINLALTWSETGASWFKELGGASAKVVTNLSLGEKAVSAPKTGAWKSKGAEDYFTIPNDFSVAQGGGLKKVTWKGYLKSPIYIADVIENTKVVVDIKGDVAQSYDVGNLYKVTTWTSKISENAKFVEVDGQKLADALYLSGKAFLSDQLDYFYSQYN
jgi:hypothetical protein